MYPWIYSCLLFRVSRSCQSGDFFLYLSIQRSLKRHGRYKTRPIFKKKEKKESCFFCFSHHVNRVLLLSLWYLDIHYADNGNGRSLTELETSELVRARQVQDRLFPVLGSQRSIKKIPDIAAVRNRARKRVHDYLFFLFLFLSMCLVSFAAMFFDVFVDDIPAGFSVLRRKWKKLCLSIDE